MTQDIHKAVEAIWRIESARVIGGLARMLGDVSRAEDLAQEALLIALERWPEQGIPENPGAWLTTTAKRRAIDGLRRTEMMARKHVELKHESDETAPEVDLDEPVRDDVLRLIFITCHPVLNTDARVALTLRLVTGLSTEEIARAYLVPEPTLAQRLVRAKKTLGAAQVPFELPPAAELSQRLDSVLEVIYLIFNEGYAATSGDDWLRGELCDEALRLGRTLAELCPTESEVHGLVALLELQASRSRARVNAQGEPILLLDQDRMRWDQLLIRRGLAALQRAQALPSGYGPYSLQAGIAACHAVAKRPQDTDWERIVALYDALAALVPSPVVELNRAVAVSMAFGPAAGLELVDALQSEPSLSRYHLLPAVRADLLAKLGRTDEARTELERAAFMTRNGRERALLLERAKKLA
ncbi:MAG: RNA polymerase sigma factor [Polyangiaceae bacterium]